MTAHHPHRDPLARLQPTKIDYERVKREAWRRDGILVVDVDGTDGLSWPDRRHLENVGVALYGPRGLDKGAAAPGKEGRDDVDER